MDFSRLSYGQVQSMADQLKKTSVQMESVLAEVKALFDKIGTDEVWNGTAASTTREDFNKLSAKFPEFSQSIDDCYKYLLSVVENFKAVDNIATGE